VSKSSSLVSIFIGVTKPFFHNLGWKLEFLGLSFVDIHHFWTFDQKFNEVEKKERKKAFRTWDFQIYFSRTTS
jgi:hypothetical protein